MRDEGLIIKKYRELGNKNESPDMITEFFFNSVKDNMHLSICMSPVGDTFRNYCRNYPALINCTTIDWFMAWPEEALIEVAMKFLNQMDLPDEKRQGLANICGLVHSSTFEQADKMLAELRRVFYVTPVNFIELLKGFEKLISKKREEIGKQITKLQNGLRRLEEAREEVKVMTINSETSRIEVNKTAAAVQQLVNEAKKDQEVADEKKKFIEAESEKIEKESEIARQLAADADREL
jgi:dynein heavy chain